MSELCESVSLQERRAAFCSVNSGLGLHQHPAACRRRWIKEEGCAWRGKLACVADLLGM